MRILQLLALLALSGAVGAQSGLEAARAIGVNLERAMIPVEEILSGGPPPQGIPALGFSGDHAGVAGPTGAPGSPRRTKLQAGWAPRSRWSR